MNSEPVSLETLAEVYFFVGFGFDLYVCTLHNDVDSTQRDLPRCLHNGAAAGQSDRDLFEFDL